MSTIEIVTKQENPTHAFQRLNDKARGMCNKWPTVAILRVPGGLSDQELRRLLIDTGLTTGREIDRNKVRLCLLAQVKKATSLTP